MIKGKMKRQLITVENSKMERSSRWTQICHAATFKNIWRHTF